MIALMFLSATQALDLPPGLLSALCYVESGHDMDAVHKDDGNENSVGICQLHLSTARMLGFKGSERKLMQLEVNIKYAALYLKHQLQRYPLSKACAVAAYNAGSCRFNQKQQIKNRKYVKKVYVAWGQAR